MPRELELVARERLFAEVAAGVAAIRASGSGDARRYSLLLPGLRTGAGVLVFSADGRRIGQVPGPVAPPCGGAPEGGVTGADLAKVAPKQAAVVYGHDFDVDSAGYVYIADRGANAVKIFDPAGALRASISLTAPTSVAVLDSGEVAVTSLKSRKLVSVFALRPDPARPGTTAWRLAREFGDTSEVTETASGSELNRYLNLGRIVADPAGNLYYAFAYLPEPTVRKYDRYGYAQYQAELTALDVAPAAQAARRNIEGLSRSRYIIGESPPLLLKPTVTALAVDPETQQVWVALGGVLLHLDREGDRRATYRMYTREGVRVEASAILVEPDRLLIASDALGVFAFPRPDKPQKK
jgi:hypothetical protein